MADLASIDLTEHQRRVAEQIVGNPTSLSDIQHMIGGAARDRPDIAGSFMKRLGTRLDGSWWHLERRYGTYAIWRVTAK